MTYKFKLKVLDLVINQQKETLSIANQAASEARKGAIDEQSKAETQYDTLGLENAFLAEGQSRRAYELEESIQKLTNIRSQIEELNPISKVKIGSLIEVDLNESCALYFLLPEAAGCVVSVDSKKITVITPTSPLGATLQNAEEGDEVEFIVSGKKTLVEVLKIS